MNEFNIRVAVSGASGRMGRQLIKYLLCSSKKEQQPLILTGVVTRSGSEFVGCDVGSLIGIESFGIVINDSIEAIHEDFDILIDFSSTQSTLDYLKICKIYKKNMVIGTTGFTDKEFLSIQSVSDYIGIVYSPNFSVMINLLLELLKRSVSVLRDCLDIEIIEMHHRNKRDVPSGTALRIREVIESELSSFENSFRNLGEFFSANKRSVKREIKIHAIRAGGIVGEHSVFFIDPAERLELIHRAYDRDIFAKGAIYSAIWLGNRKVGLFSMNDVLGLNRF